MQIFAWIKGRGNRLTKKIHWKSVFRCNTQPFLIEFSYKITLCKFLFMKLMKKISFDSIRMGCVLQRNHLALTFDSGLYSNWFFKGEVAIWGYSRKKNFFSGNMLHRGKIMRKIDCNHSRATKNFPIAGNCEKCLKIAIFTKKICIK